MFCSRVFPYCACPQLVFSASYRHRYSAFRTRLLAPILRHLTRLSESVVLKKSSRFPHSWIVCLAHPCTCLTRSESSFFHCLLSPNASGFLQHYMAQDHDAASDRHRYTLTSRSPHIRIVLTAQASRPAAQIVSTQDRGSRCDLRGMIAGEGNQKPRDEMVRDMHRLVNEVHVVLPVPTCLNQRCA